MPDAMTAYTHFQHSIAAARQLILMYKELRRHRGLGQRGSLTPANEDLLWLPRSAVVACLSSQDAYIHAIIVEKIPQALRANPVPAALCDAMADILPIKNANTFRDALPIIAAPDVYLELAKRLNDRSISFLSYQAPEKIVAGYELIGYPNIFDSVSDIWPGPRTSAGDLRRTLANYVKRRNQIAHEGDREATGVVRHMQPVYAHDCVGFVESFVSRLNRIVYGI
jgi:hypothetical protein